MSRSTVRAAIAAFLQPPAVAGLSSVTAAQPRYIPDTAYLQALPMGTATGAVAWPWIESQADVRRTLGPVAGKRVLIRYQVGLIVRVLSNQADAGDAQNDADAIMEALLERLRSDPQFGTAGSSTAISQAGVGTGPSTPDLEVTTEWPEELEEGGALLIWSVLRITVEEFIVLP